MGPQDTVDAELTVGKQLDLICTQFQSSLQAGTRPRIEDYCEDWPEPEKSELLFRLLNLELAELQQLQLTPSRDEYRQRFPDHVAVVDSVFPPRSEHDGNSLIHHETNPERSRGNQMESFGHAPIAYTGLGTAIVPKPDAPLQRIGRGLIRIVHSLVLLAIVGLLMYYFMTLAERWQQPAVVKIVAPNLVEISSPTEGVFVAVGHVPRGTRVTPGHVLGQIRAPKHEAELKTARRRLAMLLGQRIELRDRLRENRQYREINERIIATHSEVDRLSEISRQLTVRSPIDGQVESGFSGSKAVTTNETVASIWPDGGELLLEVRAPLRIVHRLISKNEVRAYFPTSEGEVLVRGEPIADSLRPLSVNEGEPEKKQEFWGLIQCRVLSIPGQVARPGLMGRL